MLGRFLILIAMMLFGPLFIEVYLYHPLIALEHDPFAVIPLVASPLALFAGFLLLAADSRATAVMLGIVCTVEVAVGIVGTAIHIAMHAPTLSALVTDPNVWLGQPPPLVPLSFAAAGCLGLIPVLLPGQRQLEQSPAAIARILYAMAATGGLAATAAGISLEGAAALVLVIATLGFGVFGFAAELAVLVYPFARAYLARRTA